MNYNFDSVAGYDREKEELKKLCDIFNNRKVYEEKGAKLPKGIIFYGGPGTGKTLFAKVMANVCGLKTYNIDLGSVDNETAICKKIKKVFLHARKRKEPSMIFFDEIDKVVPNSSQAFPSDREKIVLAQLLTLIDGMDSSGNIVFVATCNSYNNLPETLVRPGRIDKKIHIGIPAYSSRVDILNMYAQKSYCKFEITIEEIAKLCIGFSCAALETLINECVLHSDADGFISQKIIYEKIGEIKNEDISRDYCEEADIIDACRNIGSFVVAKTFNDGDYILNLDYDTVCNNFFNGVISSFDSDYNGDYNDYDDGEDCDEEEYEDDGFNSSQEIYYSKQDCINSVCILLGGYAAEEIVYGEVYNNLSGRLITIDFILAGMSESGLWGLPLRYSKDRNQALSYSSETIDRINEEFERIINECYLKAKRIVMANESLIKNLAPILVKVRSLDKQSCEQILKELGGV